MIEGVVDDGSIPETSFDTMPNDLDVILKQRPGVRYLEWPRCQSIVGSRSCGNGSKWASKGFRRIRPKLCVKCSLLIRLSL